MMHRLTAEADSRSSSSPAAISSTGGRLSRVFRLPLVVIAIAAVFLAAASRLVLAVSRYSVNLIFWDQWDFYTPLFNHASLWQIFTWEHAPHREGIGLVLDKFVLQSTHWNSRAEAFFMVGVLFAAGVIALHLKKKLFGRFDYSDIAIPCLFLTFAQLEALVGEENPSYSVFPELLITLYCLAWMLPKPITRYLAVLVLNFLLIYTGFGLFMGAVTIGVLLFELRRTFRTESESPRFAAVALFLATASSAGFFVHYRWSSAVAGHFPDTHLFYYPWFVGLLMSYFLSLRDAVPATVAGGFIAFAALAVLIWHGVRLWRNREWCVTDLIIVVLLSFSFLFAVTASAGRVGIGMPEAAQFSRYMGLLVPAFLAIYFHLLTWRKSAMRTVFLAAFVIVIIPGTLRIPNGYSPQIVKDGKEAWKTCIMQSGNIDYCDSATRFQAYPFPRKTHMLEKLQFLQKNRLNLYSGDR
jgi:hypothetical protein